MKQFLIFVLCAVVQFLLTGSTHAQFTANSQTITISGTASNWVGFGGYVVGSNTFGDVLLIQNGGALSNFDGIIGDLSAASNNTAVVTDSGSVWTNYQGLAIGASGAGNNLVISNGGIVFVGPAAITMGASAASSSNNTVTVTGTGSALTNNSDLYVGYFGKANRMTISAGGAVHDETGYVGDGASSSSNVVIITGPGSVWSHDYAGRAGNGLMVFGESSTGNQMTTTNGGAVYSSNIIIGNATASSSNVVTVTGAGSVWNITPGSGSGDLEVGLGGPGNQLTISDGAAVHATHGIMGGTSKNNVVTVTGTGSVWDSMIDLTVGSDGVTNTLTIGPGGTVVATTTYVSYLAGAGNRINIEGGSLVSSNVTIGNLNCSSTGQITVDAGNLIVTNATHNAVLEVLSGTLTLNGGTAIIDTLIVSNSCARFVHAGGTLIVGNYVIDPNKFRSTAVTPTGNDILLTWMMGPGATNALQAAPGNVNGGFGTNGFTDIFVVTNNSAAGTVTNYLDVGAGTNMPSRYYRVRLVP
jgi:T5SS/PEP-CTERM-associated repeat protein